MNIILNYSVITKEGSVIPNVTETFQCLNTDESKQPARDRFVELHNAAFVANLQYKIVDIPTRRVVRARYSPKGKIYHFEVDFPVKKHEAIEVDDPDYPGRHVYVIAIDKDFLATENELSKYFDVRKLRKGYKAA